MRVKIDWTLEYWQQNLTKIIPALVAVVFIFFRLTSIPAGPSLKENAIRSNLVAHKYNFVYLWHNAINAPYSVWLVALRYLHIYNLFAIRSVSAVIGLASIMIFLYIAWRLFGPTIAYLVTALAVSSLWFLQVSRLGGPVGLYSFFTLCYILIFFINHNEKFNNLKFIFTILLSAVSLYVPGMVWFLVASLVTQRRVILEDLKKVTNQLLIVLPLIWLILILPLVWSCIHNVNVLKQALGLPSRFVTHNVLTSFYHLPLNLFIRSNVSNVFSLGHLPVFDVFTTVMVAFGLYKIVTDKQYKRLSYLGGGFLLSWILFALGVVPSLPTILITMFFAANGLAYIIGVWFVVFPKNPVVRTFGVAFLSLAVTAAVWLHINQFYISWPNTPITISTYSQDT